MDISDLDALQNQVHSGLNLRFYDLDLNGVVDNGDSQFWIQDVKNTWIGDANLDGEFNSVDFVAVFQADEYEDGIANNSTWETGDWNFDREFDTSDLVAAFQDGGYEKGPRVDTVAVPEPTSIIMILSAFCGFNSRNRSSSSPSSQVGRNKRRGMTHQ